MSGFTVAFDEIYSVQTAELGVAIVATVTGYGTSVPALLSSNTADNIYIEGSTGVAGGYMLQIKESSLSASPPKGTQITCNGSASGETLQAVKIDIVNGIYEITAGDINA